MKQNGRFRHESLQDTDTIKGLLKAITNGIGAGKITLEDDEEKLVMEPSGLLRLKISGTMDDGHNKLDIRITWQDEAKASGKSAPKIK